MPPPLASGDIHCVKETPLPQGGSDYYLIKHSPILIILVDVFLKDVGLK